MLQVHADDRGVHAPALLDALGGSRLAGDGQVGAIRLGKAAG